MRSPKRQALITDAAEVLAPAITALEAAGVDVQVLPAGIDRAAALAAASQTPVVIVGFMPFDAAAISELRETQLIVRAGIGYDTVDIEAATKAGIAVANVPDFCVAEVADHTLLLLLAAYRRLPDAMTHWRKQRSWHVNAQLPEMRRVEGTRLGIVGMGRIGRNVASRALSCGWEVVAFDPMMPVDPQRAAGVQPVGLDELVATSDAITLHAPLTEENHHLINAERLAATRDGVVIVNTSRGGLIDLDALHAALSAGKVSYAALDVLDGEPTPDLDHPLLTHPDVLVTSHTAWLSTQARLELATSTAEEAIRYLDGASPRHLLNPDSLVHR
jgi:D-3-phosphoglycerate dehydrogenase / 2-oxoglutarate reductase